uniref:Uncharacterized protein n=1 Tax=Leersia perrieri TaxID=77586 RepID=A0A0D9WYN4_9ORYZ
MDFLATTWIGQLLANIADEEPVAMRELRASTTARLASLQLGISRTKNPFARCSRLPGILPRDGRCRELGGPACYDFRSFGEEARQHERMSCPSLSNVETGEVASRLEEIGRKRENRPKKTNSPDFMGIALIERSMQAHDAR